MVIIEATVRCFDCEGLHQWYNKDLYACEMLCPTTNACFSIHLYSDFINRF